MISESLDFNNGKQFLPGKKTPVICSYILLLPGTFTEHLPFITICKGRRPIDNLMQCLIYNNTINLSRFVISPALSVSTQSRSVPLARESS